MSEFSDQAEPSGSGYGMSLLLLALGLGVLTVRMKHQQQMEQVVEVTKDFSTFQATFMSEHSFLGVHAYCKRGVYFPPSNKNIAAQRCSTIQSVAGFGYTTTRLDFTLGFMLAYCRLVEGRAFGHPIPDIRLDAW